MEGEACISLLKHDVEGKRLIDHPRCDQRLSGQEDAESDRPGHGKTLGRHPLDREYEAEGRAGNGVQAWGPPGKLGEILVRALGKIRFDRRVCAEDPDGELDVLGKGQRGGIVVKRCPALRDGSHGIAERHAPGVYAKGVEEAGPGRGNRGCESEEEDQQKAGRPSVAEEAVGATQGIDHSAYIRSICSWYLVPTTFRLTFKVGVSSPVSWLNSTGKTEKRFMLSYLASCALASSMAS